MNLQSLTIIFVIIFLPIILISTYYIQQEVDTITLQTSYDTKLIDATTDAIAAFEINTSNENMSTVSDYLRSIIEASNNVFTTTMATNLGMSGASKSKILPYIPAVVYTLYDGYYIYSPTKQPKVVTDPDGVFVKVGDPGVEYLPGGEYFYDYEKMKTADKASLSQGAYSDIYNDYGKILYYSGNSNGELNEGKIACITEPNNAYKTTDYILKSYIPYSMQYKWGANDVTINYTLDNYISVYGTIGGVYYTKSGYLIDYNRITNIYINPDIDTNIDTNIENYGINEIADLVNNDEVVVSITVDGIEISSDELCAKSENYTGDLISDNKSAIIYYLKAYKFSKWVDDNLSGINPSQDEVISSNLKNLQDGFSIKQNGETLENFKEEAATLFWDYNEESIFKTKNSSGELKWNVEDIQSNFCEHKRKVIKNSIQYSLNQAMATYNQGQGDEYYQMPLLSEPEWDKLLSNVSILAFMQGLPCGLKTYNNYALVTSSNNEIMTNEEHIYYVPVENILDENITDENYVDNLVNQLKTGKIGVLTTEQMNKISAKYKEDSQILNQIKASAVLPTAHKIDCNDIYKEVQNPKYFQSFPSREVKYDKEFNSKTRLYEYDHVCNSCYECIINSNYDSEYQTLKNKKDLSVEETTKLKELEKVKLIAIAKIRNNTYKSCEITNNYGIKIENNIIDLAENNNEHNIFAGKDIKDFTEIQITLKCIEDENKIGNNTITLGTEESLYSLDINKNSQTIIFNDPSKWNEELKIGSKSDDKIARIKIESILYKYK